MAGPWGEDARRCIGALHAARVPTPKPTRRFFSLGSILLYYAAMVGDEHLAMRAALERARISRVSLRLFGCASEVARHIEGNQSSSVLSIAQQEMNSGSVVRQGAASTALRRCGPVPVPRSSHRCIPSFCSQTASIVLTLGSLVIALSPTLL